MKSLALLMLASAAVYLVWCFGRAMKPGLMLPPKPSASDSTMCILCGIYHRGGFCAYSSSHRLWLATVALASERPDTWACQSSILADASMNVNADLMYVMRQYRYLPLQ